MKWQYVLLGFLAFLAIVSELISYGIPSLASRIVLLTCFSALLLMIIFASSNYIEHTSPRRKAIEFAILLVISLSFALRRSYLMSPVYIRAVVHSESFVFAQSYNKSGALTFTSPHSFSFQSPLIFNLLSNISGISIEQVVYISLSSSVILVALIGTLILEIVKGAFKNVKGIGSYVIPALIAFSVVSFAYSERTELGLLLMLVLMCYLFNEGFTHRRKAISILILVLGITFGSATSIFVMIPFFFLFAVFERRITRIVNGLIPLVYLINTGYSYMLSLRTYLAFSWEGFLDFLSEIMGGRLPERVVPWHRLTVPTIEDMYVTSVTYLSLLFLSVIVVMICLFILAKEPFDKRSDVNALFLAALVVLSLAIGVALLSYIGASVKPETTFSDIRTITFVFIMLLLPFLFVFSKLLSRITANKFMLTLIVALMILASLRTFYDLYPKSSYDPINSVEDNRIDPISVYPVGDFLKTFKTGGSIAFDYKTARLSGASLPPESFQSGIFTLRLWPSSLVVFDINGLKLGSLYTTQQAYEEAYNLTLTQNVIYNNGNITIVQRK